MYRDAEISLPVGIDIVIVARKPVCEIKYQVLSDYMNRKGIQEIIRLSSDKKFYAGKKK